MLEAVFILQVLLLGCSSWLCSTYSDERGLGISQYMCKKLFSSANYWHAYKRMRYEQIWSQIFTVLRDLRWEPGWQTAIEVDPLLAIYIPNIGQRKMWHWKMWFPDKFWPVTCPGMILPFLKWNKPCHKIWFSRCHMLFI